MGFLTPLNINAMRTPGNILCATVSPMSVFLRRKLNVPTAPLTPPNSKIARATYRTLGVRKGKVFNEVVQRLLQVGGQQIGIVYEHFKVRVLIRFRSLMSHLKAPVLTPLGSLLPCTRAAHFPSPEGLLCFPRKLLERPPHR
jgi:hypothetical protein